MKSGGVTLNEAALNAEEALASHLIEMAESGEGIPMPSDLDQLEADPEVEAVATILVRAELLGRAVRVNVTLDEGLAGPVGFGLHSTTEKSASGLWPRPITSSYANIFTASSMSCARTIMGFSVISSMRKTFISTSCVVDEVDCDCSFRRCRVGNERDRLASHRTTQRFRR